MKTLKSLLPICGLALMTSLGQETESLAGRAAFSTSPVSGLVAAQMPDKLVYADFETMKDNRPVSSRGGYIQLFAYQERVESKYKGAGTTNAPELVRISKESPNRAAAFDFDLQSPNQYAGVTLEVHGLPDEDGKMVADDVSRFKYLTLQIYATGVQSAAVEFVSKGQGVAMGSANPRMSFKIAKGFNTYKVPLHYISQPSWADVRVDPKEVLKKLTSVNVVVSCNQCTPTTGTLVVDNLIFQN